MKKTNNEVVDSMLLEKKEKANTLTPLADPVVSSTSVDKNKSEMPTQSEASPPTSTVSDEAEEREGPSIVRSCEEEEENSEELQLTVQGYTYHNQVQTDRKCKVLPESCAIERQSIQACLLGRQNPPNCCIKKETRQNSHDFIDHIFDYFETVACQDDLPSASSSGSNRNLDIDVTNIVESDNSLLELSESELEKICPIRDRKDKKWKSSRRKKRKGKKRSSRSDEDVFNYFESKPTKEGTKGEKLARMDQKEENSISKSTVNFDLEDLEKRCLQSIKQIESATEEAKTSNFTPTNQDSSVTKTTDGVAKSDNVDEDSTDVAEHRNDRIQSDETKEDCADITETRNAVIKSDEVIQDSKAIAETTNNLRKSNEVKEDSKDFSESRNDEIKHGSEQEDCRDDGETCSREVIKDFLTTEAEIRNDVVKTVPADDDHKTDKNLISLLEDEAECLSNKESMVSNVSVQEDCLQVTRVESPPRFVLDAIDKYVAMIEKKTGIIPPPKIEETKDVKLDEEYAAMIENQIRSISEAKEVQTEDTKPIEDYAEIIDKKISSILEPKADEIRDTNLTESEGEESEDLIDLKSLDSQGAIACISIEDDSNSTCQVITVDTELEKFEEATEICPQEQCLATSVSSPESEPREVEKKNYGTNELSRDSHNLSMYPLDIAERIKRISEACSGIYNATERQTDKLDESFDPQENQDLIGEVIEKVGCEPVNKKEDANNDKVSESQRVQIKDLADGKDKSKELPNKSGYDTGCHGDNIGLQKLGQGRKLNDSELRKMLALEKGVGSDANANEVEIPDTILNESDDGQSEEGAGDTIDKVEFPWSSTRYMTAIDPVDSLTYTEESVDITDQMEEVIAKRSEVHDFVVSRICNQEEEKKVLGKDMVAIVDDCSETDDARIAARPITHQGWDTQQDVSLSASSVSTEDETVETRQCSPVDDEEYGEEHRVEDAPLMQVPPLEENVFVLIFDVFVALFWAVVVGVLGSLCNGKRHRNKYGFTAKTKSVRKADP